MAKTRLISEDQIKEMLTMDAVVHSVEKTFIGLGKGEVLNPTKVLLDMGQSGTNDLQYEGYMNAMPAYIGAPMEIAGLKWAGGFDGGRKEAGYPYINAIIVLLDPKMGTFEAVMDGTYITNVRTGAQVPLSMKYSGIEPGSDVKVGMFGSGMQAHMSTEAISVWYNITDLMVWDLKEEYTEPFVNNMQKFVDNPITFSSDIGEVGSFGDVVVTATKAEEPFLKYEDLEGDTVLVTLGSGSEIDNEIIQKANNIIVDHIGQAMHRGALAIASEQGLIKESDILGTIGDIAAGNVVMEDKSGITLAVPIGQGSLDVAIAHDILEIAKEKDIGEIFEFGKY